MADALQTRLSLIDRVRDPADSGAWREFATLYTPIIFGFLTKRGLSQTDAEDVTQEVFRSLAQALPGFELDKSVGTFRNWLFTVTRSKMNNHLRKSQRVDIPMAEIPEKAETKDWDHFYCKEVFSKACQLARLHIDEQSWIVFWRTAVEDESPKQVAEDLQLSLDNVYQKRSRVTARVQEAITSIDGSSTEAL